MRGGEDRLHGNQFWRFFTHARCRGSTCDHDEVPKRRFLHLLLMLVEGLLGEDSFSDKYFDESLLMSELKRLSDIRQTWCGAVPPVWNSTPD